MDSQLPLEETSSRGRRLKAGLIRTNPQTNISGNIGNCAKYVVMTRKLNVGFQEEKTKCPDDSRGWFWIAGIILPVLELIFAAADGIKTA